MHSSLLFGHPPPHERERESEGEGTLKFQCHLVGLNHGPFSRLPFLRSLSLLFEITPTHCLFICKGFLTPSPLFSPCERQFVCLPYQHLLSRVQIQKQIHKLQIQILVNRTTRIILMSSWKSFQICRPPLSSPLIANCQKSRSGTQITESPNQS